MTYAPAADRYATMLYRRCGASGLKLPVISLGLWHNFGDDTAHETKRAIARRAFDLGITHFDLANNYGPPPGSAEAAFGEILRTDFRGHRDELVISTKAGYRMWPGPYGEWGSRKYLISSLDQSLKRMKLACLTSGQPFNGRDSLTMRLNGKRDARPRGLAFQQNRTGTAHPVLASHVSACQSERVTQEVAQQQPRFDGTLVPHSVDREVNRYQAAHVSAPNVENGRSGKTA